MWGPWCVWGPGMWGARCVGARCAGARCAGAQEGGQAGTSFLLLAAWLSSAELPARPGQARLRSAAADAAVSRAQRSRPTHSAFA